MIPELLICWWGFVQYLRLPWLGSCVTAPDIFMNLDWKLPSLGELCPTSYHDKGRKTWRVSFFWQKILKPVIGQLSYLEIYIVGTSSMIIKVVEHLKIWRKNGNLKSLWWLIFPEKRWKTWLTGLFQTALSLQKQLNF